MKQIREEADVAVKNVSLTYLDKNGTSKKSRGHAPQSKC